MLHVVTTGAYYPPVVTTWKILTTGASQLTTEALCTVAELMNYTLMRLQGDVKDDRDVQSGCLHLAGSEIHPLTEAEDIIQAMTSKLQS